MHNFGSSEEWGIILRPTPEFTGTNNKKKKMPDVFSSLHRVEGLIQENIKKQSTFNGFFFFNFSEKECYTNLRTKKKCFFAFVHFDPVCISFNVFC